jgi:hypothetical protein
VLYSSSYALYCNGSVIYTESLKLIQIRSLGIAVALVVLVQKESVAPDFHNTAVPFVFLMHNYVGLTLPVESLYSKWISEWRGGRDRLWGDSESQSELNEIAI